MFVMFHFSLFYVGTFSVLLFGGGNNFAAPVYFYA